jgi:DNA repair exonuclease SbcCD ATPase subunit
MGRLTNQVNFTYSSLDSSRKGLQPAEEDLGRAALQVADMSFVNRIPETKIQIKANQERIDSLKVQSANGLEAVLGTIRAKSKVVYQKQKPIEVTALEAELDKQRSRLGIVREKDSAVKLEVEKQRSDLRLIIQTNQKDIGKKPSVLKILEESKSREKTLLEQKCSECKREWVGKDAEATLQKVKETIESAEFQLEAIRAMEESNAAKLVELQAIKDPVPHPAGKQVKDRIDAIGLETRNILEAFESAKRQEINTLELEEKTTKKQFSDKLALDLQEYVKRGQELQNALERDLSDERKILEAQAQLKAKQAVVEERRSQVTTLEASYKASLEKKTQLESDLNLEKDVLALIGRSGFLGSIVEEVLVEIAAAANDILGQVANVRHLSIEFETERVAKTTDNVAAKITPIIYSRGRKVSFASGISGGMQAAVELAVDLAVGDVVSRRRGSYPGFLLLDEALDGLGATEKESCLEMLRISAGDRLILVVDHDSAFQGLFDSIIEVEMSDGRSRIVV